jgi:membrane-associated protein
MILLGYWLAHIPGVAAAVSHYIDIVLVGIVVISVVPVIVRAIVLRRRSGEESA